MSRPCLAFLILLYLFLGFIPLLAQTEKAQIEKTRPEKTLTEKEEILELLYEQPLDTNRKDFIFTVEQEVDTENPKIIIFNLDRPESNRDAKYTLRYFLEGHIESVLSDIQLPYIFKRNFAGQKAGEHSVVFELQDAEGKISFLIVKICVQ